MYFRNPSVVAAYCDLRLFFNSSPALCRTYTAMTKTLIMLHA